MKIKEGAILAGLQIQMRKALKAADRIWRDYGEELVVTSGLDGAHSAGSMHYYGYAVDLRTRYFTEDEQLEIRDKLVNELGPSYFVLLHNTHIHIHYRAI